MATATFGPGSSVRKSRKAVVVNDSGCHGNCDSFGGGGQSAPEDVLSPLPQQPSPTQVKKVNSALWSDRGSGNSLMVGCVVCTKVLKCSRNACMLSLLSSL